MHILTACSQHSKSVARALSTPFAPITFVAILLCAPFARAVDYGDPNLNGKTDAISKAAMSCVNFIGLDNEFKTCLANNGVTERDDQVAALAAAKTYGGVANYTSSSRAEPSAGNETSGSRLPATASKSSR